jgi:hypothetical protein
MAKKETRGLPSDFDLKLPADKPVQLGDYLDEEEALTRAGNSRTQTEAPAAWAYAPGTVPAVPRTPPAAPIPALPPQPQDPRAYFSRQQLRPGAVPRKQLNATPETMRMLDDLLLQIRQQSMEKDVRISEIFHAMVLCVYEARSYLDLSTVQPRGRWGSSTAASLPVALKNAFMDAIGRARPRR